MSGIMSEMRQTDKQSNSKIPVRSGLRKRFFLTVVLPPLIPFMVLGFFGYTRLSDLIRASLVDQLARSSATTAAKVEREMSIRQTILVKTGEDILATKADFTAQRNSLATKRDNCNQILARSPSHDNFTVTSPIESPECEPFLSEFAKNRGMPTTSSVNTGFAKISDQLNADETSTINNRVQAFKLFFPETVALVLINKEGTTVTQTGTSSLLPAELLIQAQDGSVVETSLVEDRRLVQTAYLLQDHSIGAVYDASHDQFLKPSWETTPKPHPKDQVYIADKNGAVIYPSLADNPERVFYLKQLADNDENNIADREFRFSDDSTSYVARGSHISGVGWAVMVASPSSLILSPLRDAQVIALAALGISLAVSMLVGLVFVTSATRALKRLRIGALTFASGNLDHTIKLSSGDELQTLAETLNEMARQIKSAEKALDEKNKEFINIATHELKAPMTAIIGNLSMIVDDGMGSVDTKARALLTDAYIGTTRLRDLVTDLLDIARLEGGKMAFDIKPLDISEQTRDALAIQAVTAKAKQIKLSYIPTALPKVAADQTKLQIILTNFISNAIKYNRPGGSVTIKQQVDGDKVVTTISDTGLGIPAEQQAQMFQKFFRVSGKDRAEIPGTGLGMYITSQFIEAMGGQLKFESLAGKGTSFHFSLPIYKT